MKTTKETLEAKREEMRNILKDVNLSNPKSVFYTLRDEINALEKKVKRNEIELFVFAHNIVNEQILIQRDLYKKEIEKIIGVKFYSINDWSILKRHKENILANSITTKNKKGRFSYRMTVSIESKDYGFTRINISVDVWNEKEGINCSYSSWDKIAELDGSKTTFKNVCESDSNFDLLSTSKELKKMEKYNKMKNQLSELKTTLNLDFSRRFNLSFERDRF